MSSLGGRMYSYERCMNGEHVKINETDAKEFLLKVIADSSGMAYKYLPWDCKNVYSSLPDELNDFVKRSRGVVRLLKKNGIEGDAAKFAAAVIVTKKLTEILGIGVPVEKTGCDKNFVHFIYIDDNNKKAIKRFSFTENSNEFDVFRAFASIQSSAIIKLCGKTKKIKRDKNALDSFDPSNASFCDVIITLKKLGVDTIVDIKKLDKYINSL